MLVVVIARTGTAQQIRDWTGLPWESAKAGIAHLKRRDVVRNLGGGHYGAQQRSCAGSCLRQGRELRGHEVVVDPETLRWFCSECWDAESEHVRSIVVE